MAKSVLPSQDLELNRSQQHEGTSQEAGPCSSATQGDLEAKSTVECGVPVTSHPRYTCCWQREGRETPATGMEGKPPPSAYPWSGVKYSEAGQVWRIHYSISIHTAFSASRF